MGSQESSKEESAPNSWREPLFADLLQSIRLRSSVYFRRELRAPWGFSLANQGTTFHIVAQGNCWLEVKGVAKSVELTAGDFVVMLRGSAEIVRDSPASPIVDFFTLTQRNVPDNRGVFPVGGNGPVTKLVCGGMQFEDAATDTLLAILLPLIHVKGKEGSGTRWLQATVTHILEELEPCRAVWQEVVTRLADITGNSDGLSNTRLYLPATAFDRFAVTREINDGLLAPRFAPGQRSYVLSGLLTRVDPAVPASEGRDSDNR